MEMVKTILQQMSNVTQPQHKFIMARLPLLMSLRERASFHNPSRYSDCHKKTFSRFHFNVAMTALNLLKLEDRQHQSSGGKVLSIANWKIRKANAHLLERFSSYSDRDLNRIKSRPDFKQLCNYGAIAA
jgi:hypothetical protein